MSTEFLFPSFDIKLRTEGGLRQVWDVVRKKWVALGPEEWVRQHLLNYMISELNVPLGLIRVEQMLKVNTMERRADVVVYSRQGTPLLLAECKAPDIKIDRHAFDQAAAYNLTLNVPYLLLTNGQLLYFCHIDTSTGKLQFLDRLPRYDHMLAPG